MSRKRHFIVLTAAMATVAWAAACGDGGTEPPAPPPDPPRPTTVTVTPATAELTALGETVQLQAEVRDQNGQVMAGAAVTWASSSAAVATVSAAGLVTAAGNGTATITATAGGVSGTATVTVAQEVSAVAISPAADTLVVGDTLRLAAEATDANGHTVAEAEFEWASSDTSVVRVDGSGLVTGVAAGEAEITATSSGVTGRAQVTVVAPVPTTVAVTPDSVVFTAIGQTEQLAAEVRDQIGRPMVGVAVSWSSADTIIAAVDSAGLVTAAGIGITTVAATEGEVSGTALVTVEQSAGSVIVSPQADTIAAGDTLRLLAEAYDENGHPVENAQFSWSSSDVSVARVDVSGLVHGVAAGTATITATAGDTRGTSEITVENPDRAALVALYEATNGPNWRHNENWLTDAPLGEWYGVETDGSGRVARLELAGGWDDEAKRIFRHGLYGPIPPELGRLTNLTELILDANSLLGPIPPELGNLVNLTSLSLGDNNLTGPIPSDIDKLSKLTSLRLFLNHLSGPIPPQLGNLANLRRLDLSNNRLTGPIPPELGNLVNLRRLELGLNELTGPIPPELGNLVNLTVLHLGFNELTGSIPRSLFSLAKLSELFLDLCVPGTVDFVAWIKETAIFQGSFCNAADVAALTSLYQAVGGSAWTDSDQWLGTAALGEWHGVSADSLGRVAVLDLTRNGLAGQLPSNLGDLTQMTELRIGGNALSGRLPMSLARLALREFRYAETGLCTPVEERFRAWLAAIPSHEGTGVQCTSPTEREILMALYHATGGPNWVHNEAWLTDAPLSEWHGVQVDGQRRVVALSLSLNNMKGSIPPELGDLANLRELYLSKNALSGPIPPELSKLSNVEWLSLWQNKLEGSIPAELGDLANLRELDLSKNALAGPIPPELARLTNLRELYLGQNELEGSVPAELGNLARLGSLELDDNDLAGPIPPELARLSNLWLLSLAGNGMTGPVPAQLGGLASLERLYLGNNDLEGPVPPEFAGLDRLRELALSGNVAMSGALPTSLMALQRLEVLVAGATDLCAPRNPDLQTWLESIPKRQIKTCATGATSMTYLTQAVQSREIPVPLVAGEKALLRVFSMARQATSEGIPAVRARFYRDGREVHLENIPGKSTPIPTEVDEGSLAQSANAEIPADVMQPGLEMVIEVDPEGTLDEALGVAKRIPETGRLAVEVRAMPLFDLTVIPFIWSETPHDSSIVDLIEAMAADPEHHMMLADTRTLLPIGDLGVTAHEPVVSSSNNAFRLLDQTKAIRAMEGGTGYYLGMMAWPVTGSSGVAQLPGRSSFSVPGPPTVAHEFGHNLSLSHAPCGAGGPDPSFPSSDGSIGAWGYDFRGGGMLVPPSRTDLMGYCVPHWISDYHFTNALRYRLFDEGASSTAATAPTKSLLLWGGVSADGLPFLEPAFVVDARPALPDSAGEYVVTGRAASGAELFTLSFAMPETADGDGNSSFAFVLPVRPSWEGGLASITLSGPGGTVTLDGESDRPMAILRDPRNGQVRGILRDLPPATQAARDAAGRAATPGLEVLFSRGIPDAAAWRR